MTRFVYTLLIAALAIVGVAMSSHSAAASAHASGSAIAVSEAGHDGQHHAIAAGAAAVSAAAPASAPAFDADCAECALGEHSMQLLACAFLALLVATALVRPRLALALLAPAAALRGAVARLVDLAPAQRPPDLFALGISRT